MTVDGSPIATGGVYDHVGILDKLPELRIYRHWLALVYTIPQKRHQGFGASLCKNIEEEATNLSLPELHLFTDTAETLYKRLDWSVLKRIVVNNRDIVIMNKELKLGRQA